MANPLFGCTSPTCNAKMTRNQLYGSNGKCIHCKTTLTHTSWLSGRDRDVTVMVGLNQQDTKDLKKLCKEAEIDVKDAVTAAVALKLKEWLEDPEQVVKRVKQDLMLEKLMRR